MAHTYQKHRHTRSRSKSRSSSRSWTWLFTGILVGVVSVVGVHQALEEGWTLETLKRAVMGPTTKRLADPTKPTVPNNKAHAKKENNKGNQKKYEFYTLLPGMEVPLPDAPTSVQASRPIQPVANNAAVGNTPPIVIVVPANSTTTPAAHSPTPVIPLPATPVAKAPQKITDIPSQNKITTAHYLVQAGVFRELNKADELKARLTLHGFNTEIQKIEAQDGCWYRVTLGPFAKESLAMTHKKRLAEHKIQGILVLHQNNTR